MSHKSQTKNVFSPNVHLLDTRMKEETRTDEILKLLRKEAKEMLHL